MLRKILIVVVVILAVIQFIRPPRNTEGTVSANGIRNVVNVPDSVSLILAKACFDCHSNNTRYPWYSNVQPVGWWLDRHITDGKKELNFSEFASYTGRRQANKLSRISEVVSEGDMPLKSYRLIHRDARLSDNEKKLLIRWADLSREKLEAR